MVPCEEQIQYGGVSSQLRFSDVLYALPRRDVGWRFFWRDLPGTAAVCRRGACGSHWEDCRSGMTAPHIPIYRTHFPRAKPAYRENSLLGMRTDV